MAEGWWYKAQNPLHGPSPLTLCPIPNQQLYCMAPDSIVNVSSRTLVLKHTPSGGEAAGPVKGLQKKD